LFDALGYPELFNREVSYGIIIGVRYDQFKHGKAGYHFECKISAFDFGTQSGLRQLRHSLTIQVRAVSLPKARTANEQNVRKEDGQPRSTPRSRRYIFWTVRKHSFCAALRFFGAL
jgi:hypothetical protein